MSLRPISAISQLLPVLGEIDNFDIKISVLAHNSLMADH